MDSLSVSTSVFQIMKSVKVFPRQTGVRLDIRGLFLPRASWIFITSLRAIQINQLKNQPAIASLNFESHMRLPWWGQTKPVCKTSDGPWAKGSSSAGYTKNTQTHTCSTKRFFRTQLSWCVNACEGAARLITAGLSCADPSGHPGCPSHPGLQNRTLASLASYQHHALFCSERQTEPPLLAHSQRPQWVAGLRLGEGKLGPSLPLGWQEPDQRSHHYDLLGSASAEAGARSQRANPGTPIGVSGVSHPLRDTGPETREAKRPFPWPQVQTASTVK